MFLPCPPYQGGRMLLPRPLYQRGRVICPCPPYHYVWNPPCPPYQGGRVSFHRGALDRIGCSRIGGGFGMRRGRCLHFLHRVVQKFRVQRGSARWACVWFDIEMWHLFSPGVINTGLTQL